MVSRLTCTGTLYFRATGTTGVNYTATDFAVAVGDRYRGAGWLRGQRQVATTGGGGAAATVSIAATAVTAAAAAAAGAGAAAAAATATGPVSFPHRSSLLFSSTPLPPTRTHIV